jgi:SAM-dependent methyltransferase
LTPLAGRRLLGLVGRGPRLGTESVKRCPLCGGRLRGQQRFRDDLFPGRRLRLARCRACGFVVLDPRLTPDAIAILENENAYYDYSTDPDEELIRALEAFLEVLEGMLPRHGRLLDAGCGRGYLLEAARRRGWQAVGTEISDAAAARARQDFGACVYGSLEEVAEAEPLFDAVVVWHVLEHTLDPVAFLQDAARVLEPEGAIAIQVPGFEYLDEFERRDERGKLVCAVHTMYFDADALRRTLRRAGLEPIWFDSSETELMLSAVCTAAPRPVSKAKPEGPPESLPERGRAPASEPAASD